MVERILGAVFHCSIEPLNKNVDLKKEYGITHIVSVVPGPISSQYTEEYIHKQIPINDEETTNILQYFTETNQFIEEALNGESKDEDTSTSATRANGVMSNKTSNRVLVHCAQGVSRSVTIIVAYLMLKYNLALKQALYAVKRKCPDIEPNRGFMKQLELYESWGCKVDKNSPEYKQFTADLSLDIDPSGETLRAQLLSQKGTPKDSDDSEYDLRCKKCRQVLAKSNSIESHIPPDETSRQSQFIKTAPNSRRIISAQPASSTCSHYFMTEPLAWMRPELEKADIEGKFLCPKCDSKVGGYSWRGARCSCGKWMVPDIHIQSAKVDKLRSKPIFTTQTAGS